MLSRIGERTITHKNNIEVKFEAKRLLKKSPDSTIFHVGTKACWMNHQESYGIFSFKQFIKRVYITVKLLSLTSLQELITEKHSQQ